MTNPTNRVKNSAPSDQQEQVLNSVKSEYMDHLIIQAGGVGIDLSTIRKDIAMDQAESRRSKSPTIDHINRFQSDFSRIFGG